MTKLLGYYYKKNKKRKIYLHKTKDYLFILGEDLEIKNYFEKVNSKEAAINWCLEFFDYFEIEKQ